MISIVYLLHRYPNTLRHLASVKNGGRGDAENRPPQLDTSTSNIVIASDAVCPNPEWDAIANLPRMSVAPILGTKRSPPQIIGEGGKPYVEQPYGSQEERSTVIAVRVRSEEIVDPHPFLCRFFAVVEPILSDFLAAPLLSEGHGVRRCESPCLGRGGGGGYFLSAFARQPRRAGENPSADPRGLSIDVAARKVSSYWPA